MVEEEDLFEVTVYFLKWLVYGLAGPTTGYPAQRRVDG